MSMIATSNSSSSLLAKKMHGIVKTALPEGHAFELLVTDSGIGRTKIVRIITTAWKSQRPYQRIEKILDAMEGKLTTAERKRILRVNVLTPREWSRM